MVAAPQAPSPFLCQEDGTVPQEPSSCCWERVPARPSARDVSQRDICSAVLGQEQPRAPPGPVLPMTSLLPRATASGSAQPPRRDRTVLPQSSAGSCKGQPQLCPAAEGGTEWICPRATASQHCGETPEVPVGLRFFQELHLVLHAGTRLQLLHHHLRAADARVHLPQEHLGQGTGSSLHAHPEHPWHSRGPVSHRGGVSGGPWPWAHLAEPAMPDLLQVQQALPPQVRRLEELHCNRARPAARVSPCPCVPLSPSPHIPLPTCLCSPPFPAKPCCPHRASRCQALCHPRMLRSIHAQECCIPGILFSRHPPTIRGRVVPVSPNGMAAELAPCPFSSAGCAELSPAQRWHLAPARPPGTVRPLGSPCQGQAAMGPLLVLSAPPTVAILWAGSDTGQEGAPPTFLSHSWACLHGTRTRGCHRSGWPCPVPPRCCSPGWDTRVSAWRQGQGTLAQGDPAAPLRDPSIPTSPHAQ